MKKSTATALFGVALMLWATSCSSDTTATTLLTPGAKASAAKDANNGHITIAVIGDFPYGPDKRAEMPHLVDQINADPTIERTIHLGDIKAGSNSDCSNAYFDDIRHQFDVMDLLADLNRRDGRTIVTVLHDLHLAARRIPRIVVVADGRIVADGPPAEALHGERIRDVFGVEPGLLPTGPWSGPERAAVARGG